MSRPKADEPTEYALAVAAEIRREMGEHSLSGRAVAAAIERSEKYVRERVAGRFEFSINDVEAFALHVGITPDVIFVRAEARTKRKSNVIAFPVTRPDDTGAIDPKDYEDAVAKQDVIDPYETDDDV